MQFNTIVSGCMKLFNLLVKIPFDENDPNNPLCVNELYVNHLLIECGTKILLAILYPIAPHITHKLWLMLKLGDAVTDARWPKVSSAALTSKTISMVVQINGKLRTKLNIPSTATEEEVKSAVLSDIYIEELIRGKTVKKVILVPHRLINIVAVEN
ncbi:MAG: class I tRNA ligase family protein [Gammaproteobacteria bacterium]|nr:class I tRNA ligase family protein [Gammaproteobacteria bacterium]